MSYVFFDLEWNQGYPHSEADKLDEIIPVSYTHLAAPEAQEALTAPQKAESLPINSFW